MSNWLYTILCTAVVLRALASEREASELVLNDVTSLGLKSHRTNTHPHPPTVPLALSLPAMSSWLPFFPQFARMNNLLALPPFPSPERALASFPDFARTLPSLVVKGAFNFEGLKSWYLHADPLHSALVVCAINVAWTGVMGELTGNVSQVDRVWSFLPVL